jgi:hypothetical protein
MRFEEKPGPEFDKVIPSDDSDLKSDFFLQQRVVNVLKNMGYKTIRTHRGYFDSESKKSKQYAIFAHKDINVYGPGTYGIYPTIVCECKNNLEPVSFFIDYDIDDEAYPALKDEVMVSGIPSKIWKRNKYTSIQDFTDVLNIHHYCKPVAPVATRLCPYKLKSGRYLSTSYNDLGIERDLIKALENEIDWDFSNMSEWLASEELGKEFIDLSFYYPLVIYKGEIYGARLKGTTISDNELIPERLKHIQYNPELYSFYYNEIISYHMDIINEDYLSDFLNIIETEMTQIKNVLQKQKPVVKQSISRIIAECLSLEKKPSTYRKWLEYPF